VAASFTGVYVYPEQSERLRANLAARPGGGVERTGIAVSDDGGATWQVRALDRWILAPDPRRPDTLYARLDTPADNYAFVSLRPLLRSADGGRTWARLDEALTSFAVSVAVDPADSNRVYATRFKPDLRTWTIDGAMELIISRDGGAAWEVVTPLRPVFKFDPGTTWQLYADPAQPGGFVTWLSSNRILQTLDEGAGWRDLAFGRGFYDDPVRIVVDPNGALVYLADPARGLFRRPLPRDAPTVVLAGCTDLPATPLPPATRRDHVMRAPSDPAYRYVQTVGRDRLYQSTDGGRTWTALPFDARPYSLLTVDRWQPQRLYLTRLEFASLTLYVSDDGREPVQLSAGPIASPPLNGGRITHLYQFDSRSEVFVAELALSPGLRESVDWLYQSLDGGRTWQAWQWAARRPVIDPGDPATVYVQVQVGRQPGRYFYALYRAELDGTRRTLIDPLGSDADAVDLQVHPRDPDRLYLTQTSGHALAATRAFASTDRGATWREMPEIGPNPAGERRILRDLLLDPVLPGHLMAVTGGPSDQYGVNLREARVWWSGDDGRSWHPVRGALVEGDATNFRFHFDGTMLTIERDWRPGTRCRLVRPPGYTARR